MFKKSTCVGIDIAGADAWVVKSVRGKKRQLSEAIACKSCELSAHLSKGAVICLPDSAVIAKKISVAAALQEREIEAYLYNNLQRFTGIEAKELNLDFQVGVANKHGKKSVEFVVARKEVVAEYVKPLLQQGVKVMAIEPHSHAMARAWQWVAGKDENPSGLLNLSGKFATFCVVVAGRVVACREFVIEGKSPDEWAEELREEIKLFNTQNVESVSQLVISGTDVGLELVENIAQLVGVETRKAELLERKNFSVKQKPLEFSRFFVAAGLALWG